MCTGVPNLYGLCNILVMEMEASFISLFAKFIYFYFAQDAYSPKNLTFILYRGFQSYAPCKMLELNSFAFILC